MSDPSVLSVLDKSDVSLVNQIVGSFSKQSKSVTVDAKIEQSIIDELDKFFANS